MNKGVFQVTGLDDGAIDAAALGMRPEMSDETALPRKFRFAPSSPTYKVQRSGAGTYIYLHGTSEQGHSVCVRVDGFSPYLFVSLASIDAATQDEAIRSELTLRLIEELQARLLAVSAAAGAQSWAPERHAFKEAFAGRVRTNENSAWLVPARRHCAPIVGWQIVSGMPVRGSGPGCGYRGMAQTRFLQLFFYSPTLVPKCRAILQGENARLGAVGQAEALAASQFGPPQPVVAKTRFKPEEHEAGDGAADAEAGKEEENDDGDVEMGEGEEEDELANALAAVEIEHNVALLSAHENEDGDPAVRGEAVDDATEDSEEEQLEREQKRYPHLDGVVEQLNERLEARFQRRVRRRLEATLTERCILGTNTFDVYEADVDFVLRFALDCGFSYEHWLELDLGVVEDPEKRVSRVFERSGSYGERRETRAQIELRCHYSALQYKADDPIQNTLPKHLLMSLDCEMETGAKGAFPTPESERMLMCVFLVRDERTIEGRPAKPTAEAHSFWYRSVSFVLGSVACATPKREGCWERFVLCFDDEALLYRAMARFIQLVGASIVTGYNSDGFDLPYMRDRSRVVGAGDEFMRAWGRSIHSSSMRITQRQFESTAVGAIEYQDVRAEGVTYMDLFLKLKKDPMVKLRSLALNSVSSHYLDEQKEDVAYSLINDLAQTPAGREKLRLYCEKDTLLPLMILARQQMVGSMIEMSRINGCTMEQLLKRGQQIRSMFGLYREARVFEPRHFAYTRTQAERELQKNETFEGANVVEPKVGLYDRPVVTLDFASLYPSIMCTYNLCFSTYVAPDYDLHRDPYIMGCADPLRELTLEERERRAASAVYTVEELVAAEPFAEAPRPSGHRFLRHHIKVGLAVHTEMKLLAWRKRVKKEMAVAKDAELKELAELLNERQTQIKLLCNSLYGAFGATSSRFYCQPVSASVTARGRALLWCTASLVCADFPDQTPEVVYGDTDSVFIHLPLCQTVEEAAAVGVRMAAHVTAHMKKTYPTEPSEYNILALEFEKVFRVLLLIAKKRYAGLKYVYAKGKVQADPGDCIPSQSGLESKRRDVTLLIRNEITNVISLMVDYHYSADENLARAREYIWRQMVRPLREGRLNLELLAITKQLRMLPADYAKSNKPGATLPIHVHMAQRMIARAGGEDKPNAPRAGDRLAYVVAKGEPEQKVSERAEDPVFMLHNGLPLDTEYYLDKHVRSVFVRLFAPAWRHRLGQTRLGGNKGAAKVEANEQEREAGAAEYLFGHVREFRDPGQGKLAGVEIVPATAVQDQKDTEERIRKGRIGVVPLRNAYTGAKLRLVRHAPLPRGGQKAAEGVEATDAQKAAAATTVTGQSGLRAFAVAGAKCRVCRAFHKGAAGGFVCATCAPKAPPSVANEFFQYMRDIEDLRCERAEIAHTCHTCMGCADAPTYITCANSDCTVFWQRQNNQQSERIVAAKLKVAAANAQQSGFIEKL